MYISSLDRCLHAKSNVIRQGHHWQPPLPWPQKAARRSLLYWRNIGCWHEEHSIWAGREDPSGVPLGRGEVAGGGGDEGGVAGGGGVWGVRGDCGAAAGGVSGAGARRMRSAAKSCCWKARCCEARSRSVSLCLLCSSRCRASASATAA